ncbi:mRNA guanylyltransferase [Nematocida major]|uniref:mRNA guanylyltransferase n=1 Tax=Nematocida major TaxID=1912982 RepID=UPI002008D950|nr:mRNA guanylyltransferase [Nematocida major]KAH9385266.1 mRNA guanylyltransferase [Nematocida major]
MELCKLELGKAVSLSDSRKLLKEIEETCEFKGHVSFPGAQPVTMYRESLVDLNKKDYFVCEKSDGLRALLYIKGTEKKAYPFFIDRNCTVIQVKKPFLPCGSFLLDGEIIKDKAGKYVYMVFDMMICRSKSICEKSLTERLTMATWYLNQTQKWRATQKEKAPREGAPGEPLDFDVKIKMMHKSYGLAEVYRKIIPTLEHENDGLIFTCVNYAYRPGTCPAYFKWKPPHLNSVDFRMRKSSLADGLYALLVCTNRTEVVFDWYWKDPMLSDLEENVKKRKGAEQTNHYGEIEDYDSLDGKIGEFSYKRKEYTIDVSDYSLRLGRWSLLRIREDKKMPNGYKTVVSVVQSIRENLTFKEIEGNVEKIRQNWRNRDKEMQARSKQDHEDAKRRKE